MHAALSLFDEKFLWDELRFRLTPAEILKLEAANQFYDYEQSVTRRYIKYALNFILDAKRSKIFLEDMVYSRFGSKKTFIDNMYISIDEFRKMQQAGMSLGVHSVYHFPFDGNAGFYHDLRNH